MKMPRNPYLCLTIVIILGLVSFGGLAGIFALAFAGRPVPESLIAITSGAAGSLGSFLVMPPRGSVGMADDRSQGRGHLLDRGPEGE
jgi:hypothetical protein